MAVTVVHDSRIHEAFPDHATGVMRISSREGIRPSPEASIKLAGIFSAESGGENAHRGAEYWRTVYDNLGAKPKYRPSLQNLLDHYEEHGRLRIPVPLVELYCWFSLVHGVPMAGYRVEQLSGALRLTIPGPGHLFTPLGQPRGSQERTKPREVAYLDDEKVICRYWNYRDCDETKLIDGVTDAIFIFDLVNNKDLPGVADANDLMTAFADLISNPERVNHTVLDGSGKVQADLP
ncbi:MAG: phenylalanine--tRNA ligase beta subunit-related protein [Solirubrobacteraceae bacterium]